MIDAGIRLTQLIRGLGRSPRFAALAIATLGLGVGGNLVIFGALDQIFFRPLPLEDADRLVRIEDFTVSPDGRRMRTAVLDTHLIELVDRARAFSGIAAASDQSMTLFDAGQATRVNVLRVTRGSWTTLGVHLALGRLFSAEEERLGADADVIMLTHALWRERFGGRPEVVGATVHLDDRAYRVIGVVGAGFRFPWEADAWIPERATPSGRRDYAVFARLGSGVSTAVAAADLARIAREIKTAHPETLPGYGLELQPLRDSLLEGRQRVAVALSLLMALFLAIACANVTNLQLARVVTRRSELAVRAALGASVSAQVQLVLGESLLLALGGTVVGAIAALWLAPSFSVLIPPAMSRELGLLNDDLDWRLIDFSVLVCATSGVIAGLLPALVSARVSGDLLLRTTGRGIAGANRRRLGALVVAQLVIASMLLGAAAIVVRNFADLLHRPLGVDAEHVVSAGVTLPIGRYVSDVSRAIVARRLVERVAQLRGVDAVGLTSNNPFGAGRWLAQIDVEGRPKPIDAAYTMANHRLVSPGLFEAMRIPIMAGRAFSDRDGMTAEPVAIVSQRMARHLWPNQSPIGQRLRHVKPGQPWRRIVGVVGDVADSGEVNDTWYVPYVQEAGIAFADSFYVMAHVESPANEVLPALASAVQSVDPALPIYDIGLLSDQFTQVILPNRLGAIVVAVLSAFGLTLALIGTYSVTSYVATANRQDTALRLALGASTRDMLTHELGRMAALASVGVTLGMAGSIWSAATVRSVLVMQASNDPATTVAGALLLFTAALGAAVPPAWRAAKVSASTVLKSG